MTLNFLCRVIFNYRETHTEHYRRVRPSPLPSFGKSMLNHPRQLGGLLPRSPLPSFGKSMLNHPRQLGGLLPRLGNIIYLCFYLFVTVTSMRPHFHSWVHFT